ncbi:MULTISPECIES: hypothetical protein [Enterobacter cloacae complex]|uniref:hypothetical protein n=1 Tax=Enterobacter cloacae complex TaxID=354276 RepID=UPI000D3E288E|nr:MULTISPECIES: hypothetical protein [Enterobacter cloacae complex]AWC85814.1 hypothetical protein AM410_15825 [Enterobacter cloacae complex sp. FDA-CDC-AR_0164]MED5696200.1 hypothetical protein [Enterobacter ludwigii]
MSSFKKLMYKILSTGSEAVVPEMSTDELVMKVAQDTPDLKLWVVKLESGEVTREEFNRVCIGHIVKELYAFRKEEENSRMQAW